LVKLPAMATAWKERSWVYLIDYLYKAPLGK
jgi:hypothetical protein